MSYKCMKKIIIKRIFKDKSDILRWNYKRSFKAFLKELRDLESFTSSLHMNFKEGDYIQGQINQNLDISFSIEFNVFITYIK